MSAIVWFEAESPSLVKISPAVRLGPLSFEKYVETVRSAGGHFDPSRRSQVVPLERVEYAQSCLEKAGFVPRLDPPLRAHFRRAGDPPPERDPSLQMAPFQVEGSRWLSERPGALLGDEMGVGKTIQTLMAIPDRAPSIVIAPAAAKGVWQMEARAWRPEIWVTQLSGRHSFKWPMKGQMIVMNYDILPDGVPPPLPGTRVIADEAHAIKNPDAKRTEKFRKLAKAASLAGGSLWGLTGTPLLNRPSELQSILTELGIFEAAFGDADRFIDAFPVLSGSGIKAKYGPPNGWVAEQLKTVMLRRARKDVWPEIPEKRYRDLIVENLPAKTKQMCDDLVAQLVGRGVHSHEAISKVTWAQIESLDLAVISRVRAALATAMIPAMVEHVEMMEAAEEPLVVFSAHRAPLDILGKRTGWRIINGDVKAAERTEIVAEFQAGKLRGVGSTIQSGGTAITLTYGHMGLFVDLMWTPGLNLQAEDRICRKGQDRGVVITRLVADHLLIRHVHKIIAMKEALIAGTIDAAAVAPGSLFGGGQLSEGASL